MKQLSDAYVKHRQSVICAMHITTRCSLDHEPLDGWFYFGDGSFRVETLGEQGY